MASKKEPKVTRKANPMPKAESGKIGGAKARGGDPIYKPEMARMAATMCRLGATNQDLADAFGVSERSIEKWIAGHPEFAEACAIGKDHADDLVEQSLFRRATGYQHAAVKIFQFQGQPIEVPYVEHYPPDTTACIFWLKNRRRKVWKDRWDVELTDNTPTGELLRKARERRKRMEQGESDAS